MPWALLSVPLRRRLLVPLEGLSGHGSQVHSLAAPAPGSHLFPALWGLASRATSPARRLYVRLCRLL